MSLIERFSAAPVLPVSEALSGLLDESGYEAMLRTDGAQQRLDNLAELKQAVHEYETTCGEESGVADYLRHAALFTDGDRAESADTVRFMTVHAAKGLEFSRVFLCGMNEGIFPSRKVRTRQGMEEERRLAFVAVTRAEKGLYLSEADGTNFDGSPRYSSRFLLDMWGTFIPVPEPQEGLLKAARGYAESSNRALPPDDGAVLLPVGQRVRHFVFGLGRVLDVDLNRGAHLVQFDDMETPRRISFRAKLEAWRMSLQRVSGKTPITNNL